MLIFLLYRNLGTYGIYNNSCKVIPIALERANITQNAVDYYEINEALVLLLLPI